MVILFQPDIISKQLAPWLVPLWYNLKEVGKVSINIWLKADTVQLGTFVVYCWLVLRSNSISFYCVFISYRCVEAKTHISFSLVAMTLDVNSMWIRFCQLDIPLCYLEVRERSFSCFFWLFTESGDVKFYSSALLVHVL